MENPVDRARLPGWVSVALTASFLALVFAQTLRPVAVFDLWYNLRVGQLFVSTGHVPQSTFLSTAPFLPTPYHTAPEWGSGVVFYLAERVGGMTGLALLLAFLLTLLAGILVAACREAGLHPLAAVGWVGLGMMVLRGRVMLRAYLFTYLAVSVLAILLLRAERRGGKLPLWALGLLYLCWANLHPGVLAGVAMLVIWLVAEWLGRRLLGAEPGVDQRSLALAAAIGLGCTFVRPGGWRFYAMVLNLFSRSKTAHLILEAGPLHWHWGFSIPGAFVLVLALGFLAAWRWGRLRLPHLFEAVAFGILMLRSGRYAGELVCLCVPLAATAWASAWPSLERVVNLRRANRLVLPATLTACMALTGLTAANLTGRNRFHLAPSHRLLPFGAVAYMRQHPPPGRLLNSYEFGCFLVWSGFPPFIHGKTWDYPDKLTYWYLDILGSKTRRPLLLHRFNVGAALLHYPARDDTLRLLLAYLWKSPNWHLVQWDDAAVLLYRGPPPTRPYRAVEPWANNPFPGGHLKAAERELARLLRSRPDCLKALTLLAEAQLRQGRLASAERTCDELLARAPHDYQGWFKRGAIRDKRKNYAGAVGDFREAVSLAPRSPVACYNLALASTQWAEQLAGRGEQKRAEAQARQALQEARRAVRLKPDFEAARRLLRRLQSTLGS